MVGIELAATQPPATAAPNAQQVPAKKQKCRFFTSRKGRYNPFVMLAHRFFFDFMSFVVCIIA